MNYDPEMIDPSNNTSDNSKIPNNSTNQDEDKQEQNMKVSLIKPEFEIHD